MRPVHYTHWQARLNGLTVTAYLSGKLTVQGKNMEDFILFTLEPEILKEAGFGYENPGAAAAVVEEEEYVPHAGLDESGKGDYFGPLVIACAYLDDHAARKLLNAGVKDSKAIKSAARIAALANEIMRASNGRFAIVTIGPEAYNRLYQQFRNLNSMLAWGHARALENLLEKAPECTSVLADKFAGEHLIRNALLAKGKNVVLTQRTKAESDIAVAAASILARNAFVARMDAISRELNIDIPKGAGPAVLAAARTIVAEHGQDTLAKYVKLHFKTTAEVLA